MNDTLLRTAIAAFCATQAIARGFRDGLIIHRNGGWTSFHLLGWHTTDAVRLGLAIALATDGAYIAAVMTLATGLLHQPCYTWALRHPEMFKGTTSPPAWFRVLRRAWSWLPGQQPVLRDTDAAIAALKRNKPFTLICMPWQLEDTSRLFEALDESLGELTSTHRTTHSVFAYRPYSALEYFTVESDV